MVEVLQKFAPTKTYQSEKRKTRYASLRGVSTLALF